MVGGWYEGREAGQGAAGGQEGDVKGQARRVGTARGAPETGDVVPDLRREARRVRELRAKKKEKEDRL